MQAEFQKHEKKQKEELARMDAAHMKEVTRMHAQAEKHMTQMQKQHEHEMQLFREQNEANIQEHKDSIAKLQEQLEELDKEPFDPNDPDRLVNTQKQVFSRFCELAKESSTLNKVPKMKKASLAFLGPSGVGKSTLINALAGREVAETDVLECTQNISMVHASEQFDMYDVPGNRDERADFYNLDHLHKLKSLHVILVVYESRFEHVLNVTKLLKALSLPMVLVRNKCNYRRDPELKRAYEKECEEKAKLGLDHVPLVHIGFAEANGDKPENTDKLKEIVEGMLKELVKS